ncbi:MAG: hypothetical protein WCF90_06540 [Methanomicrobiales archaeon]
MSSADLVYQTQAIDLMGLDAAAKVQIHVGSMYGDKRLIMGWVVEKYALLDEVIKNCLVIENDERQYTIRDCF